MSPTSARRAAVHAALADVTRLRVTDALGAGDRSPGELAAELDLPSNLLAHHLNVLQAAGVVRRVHSEGDRRRTYVGLELVDPLVVQLLAPRAVLAPAPRVVFVCTRNSARSHLARAAFERTSGVPAASAGTAPAAAVHPGARAAARRAGLLLAEHPTAHVRDVLRPDDLVVAVCDGAYESSVTSDRPTVHWSVPDPVRVGSDDAFDAALTQVLVRADRLARLLADPRSTT